MEPLFELGIERAAKGARDSTQTLYQQLKAAIADGRLAAGAKLPPTRRAEAYFGVSRNTVAEAYNRLISDGLIVSRQGAGTYVADHRPMAPARAALPGLTTYRMNDFWLQPDVTSAMGFWQDPPVAVDSKAPLVDFRPALIDSRLFPHEAFRRATAHQLRGLEARPASLRSPQGNQGNYALRDAIVKHIAVTRGVACHNADVLITAGAQQAFDLLARTLVTPGETVVAIEDPGYPPMRVAFAAAGARIVPVGVDAEGLIVEDLPPEVNIICVTPSHQFPLGMSMSAERRRVLVAFARDHGAVIIEDDYDGEFRYDGAPLEALRSADNADVVFYVGTFSKCMLPSLRLGFVVAPAWAMPTLIAARNAMDWHSPIPIQKGVAAFIAEGQLDRHIRKMRMLYKRRRAALLDALRTQLAGRLTPIPSLYGMHIATTAAVPIDFDAVSQALLHHNIKLHSLSRYYLGRPDRTGLVFGFGATDEGQIVRGISRLRDALH